MNINLLLNSENLPFLDQLIKYKETEKSVKETEKSVKETKKSESVKEIIYFFNERLFTKEIIPYDDFFNIHEFDYLFNYINLLNYMNDNKNSKIVFYYDESITDVKLSQTKKILTFLNNNDDLKKIYEEIYNILEPRTKIMSYDSENIGPLYSKSELEKIKKIKKYFNNEGEIILNDKIDEFEGIEFIKFNFLNIENQKDYFTYILNLINDLPEKYNNIPIIIINIYNKLNLPNKEVKIDDDIILIDDLFNAITYLNKNIKEKTNNILKSLKKLQNENDVLDQLFEEENKNFLNYYKLKK